MVPVLLCGSIQRCERLDPQATSRPVAAGATLPATEGAATPNAAANRRSDPAELLELGEACCELDAEFRVVWVVGLGPHERRAGLVGRVQGALRARRRGPRHVRRLPGARPP